MEPDLFMKIQAGLYLKHLGRNREPLSEGGQQNYLDCFRRNTEKEQYSGIREYLESIVKDAENVEGRVKAVMEAYAERYGYRFVESLELEKLFLERVSGEEGLVVRRLPRIVERLKQLN